MTKENEKIINDVCMTAILLGMDKNETTERLIGTKAVRDSKWDEVKEIIDSWFSRKGAFKQ